MKTLNNKKKMILLVKDERTKKLVKKDLDRAKEILRKSVELLTEYQNTLFTFDKEKQFQIASENDSLIMELDTINTRIKNEYK